MITYLAHVRRFRRDVRLLLVSVFLLSFTLDGGIYTVIFNLYLLRLDYGPETIGQINSAGLFAFALVSMPVGILGSRWGSRRVMIGGLLAMLLGTALLPLGELLPTLWRSGWLLASYVLILAGISAYFVNSGPLLMGLSSPSNRSYAFSAQVALWSFGAFAGSLIGGLLPGLFANLFSLSLEQPAAYRLPLMLVTVLLVPALVVMIKIKEPEVAAATDGDRPETAGKTGLMAGFPWVLVSVLVGVRLFQVTGIASISTFFNVYLDSEMFVATVLIGVLAGVGRLVAVVASLTMPVLTTRFGNNQLVIWSSFGGAVAMLPLILVPHWAAAGASYAGVVAMASIRFPAFLVYSMEVVSPARRNFVSGAGEMAGGFSFALIALSGGYVIALFGYQLLFLVTSCCTAFSALLFWLYFRVPRGELARQVEVVGVEAKG